MDDPPCNQPETEAAPASAGPDAIPTARPIAAAAPPPPRRPDDMLLPNSTAAQAWIDIVLAIVLVFGATLAIESALWSAATAPLAGNAELLTGAGEALVQRAILIPMLLIRAFVSLLIIAMIIRRRGQRFASLGLTITRPWLNVLFGLFAAGAAYLLVLGLMIGVAMFWPVVYDEMSENATRLMTLIPRLHPLEFLPMALVIAVYEETLFRGFLMTRLRRGTKSWTIAVVLSSAVFTALHAPDQTHAALIAITALALVLAIVTILRRSLVPAIVAHMIWDFAQFAFLYYVAGDAWK